MCAAGRLEYIVFKLLFRIQLLRFTGQIIAAQKVLRQGGCVVLRTLVVIQNLKGTCALAVRTQFFKPFLFHEWPKTSIRHLNAFLL
jgi:hypothetical protein